MHYWAQAFDEVSYLQHPHRHMFKVKVEMEVYHNDREVEFIMVKHLLDREIATHLDENGVWQMEGHSCEDVAEMLSQLLTTNYPNRWIQVSVAEDGENGCIMDNTIQRIAQLKERLENYERI